MTIQIGVCSMRDPKTGAFIDTQPLFADATDDNMRKYDSMIRSAGKLFGELMGKKSEE